MDAVIYDDSPLAHYLEGEGEADTIQQNSSTDRECEPILPVNNGLSFAPRGYPHSDTKRRRRPPLLQGAESGVSTNPKICFRGACWSVINSRIAWADSTQFLEQFRYTIVASQLLNEYSNSSAYQRRDLPLLAKTQQSTETESTSLSFLGVCSTAAIAFMLAWGISWVHTVGLRGISFWKFFSALVVTTLAGTGLCLYIRCRWITSLQNQVLQHASLLISSAQGFDGAGTSAIALIQEVELVSKGYRLTTPLPPVTRLEEQNQIKRCGRIRRILQRSLITLISSYSQAFETTKPLAAESDLEKYYDIYELNQSDVQEAGEPFSARLEDTEDPDALKTLKRGMKKLYIVRKIFLCSLLAIDADRSKSNPLSWSIASESMRHLAHETSRCAMDIDDILKEEESFQAPPTPKIPLTPGRERMRTQMRKFGALSQGIRGLQAKMHILRDESDKVLDESNDVSELGANLLTQYDSIGNDLKILIKEWDEGRVALNASIGKNENRLSLSPNGIPVPMSPTLSLGGRTAVESSSPDALKSLNGCRRPPRSRSSTTNSSSGEEVFEAVALPRQKSCMTREERIAKMKEDRIRQSVAKGKAEANTHMLKELETVIKLRPRGRTTGRMTSI